jgi:hypothetical protein
MINQRISIAAIFILLALMSSGVVQGQTSPQGSQQLNFDARVEYNRGFQAAQSAEQLQSKKDFRKQWPDVHVDYSRELGTARNIKGHTKFFSVAHPGYKPRDLAVRVVSNPRKRNLMGLTQEDIADLEITNDISTPGSGAHHVFMRQRYKGIPVFGGGVQVHIDGAGHLLSINNDAVRQLAGSVARTTPSLSAAEAVIAAAKHLGIAVQQPPSVLEEKTDPQQTTRLGSPGVSSEEILARLLLMPVRDKDTRLVWNLQIHTLDHLHVYDITIDTASGQVWTRFDLIASASYQVYQQSNESPDHSLPLPPSDGRQTVYDPADPIASPLGWHNTGSASYTIMQGNNIRAYEDSRRYNRPIGTQPDCTSSLTCAFALDLAQSPSSYRPAAVTNLFYWTNLAHDIFYHYGFDEASGNFQVNNFNKGGTGNDYINAEAQDGAGGCNANFYTPADGSPGRMQMFNCGNATPSHDGDLDNAVIIHEYGHGVTNRLVGGPSNVSCLSNSQTPGEGWSDFFGLVFTANSGDNGTDARGFANYLFGLPPDGNGIRPQPYSMDPAKNNYTYASINGFTGTHNVGSVWGEVIWKMYWALVDQHGFDANLSNPPDLSNPSAWAGNQRALLYVVDGLKYTACSPTFVDARDGIIASAIAHFGGEDLCPIWKAFADFGLGTDAVSGGPNSTSPAINGFSLPPGCPVNGPGNTPTVTSVSPNNGSVNGGTAVTITGTNFVSGATVSFGGTAATGVAFSSSTTITATTPANAAGAVDVVVTNPDAQKGTLTNGFTYTSPAPAPAPTVTSVSPNNGSVNGGIPVSITGTNFVSGATVSFGGAAATGVVFTSSTTITATTPANAAGAVDVVVTNPDAQKGTLTNGFTYITPPSALPDFVVTSVTLSPTIPRVRLLFSVSVVVKNQGAAAGNAGTLAVWINKATTQACGAVANKTATVGDLAAGESKTILVQGLSVGTVSNNTLRAFLDANCVTSETNEENNQLTKAYAVR